MAIKNISVVYDDVIDINRSAIEHRATWMGLTYQAALDAGVDAEAITRKAISQTGRVHGVNFKSMCPNLSCSEFAKVFLTRLGRTTFQQVVHEITEDSIRVDFHYCPLLNAWLKLGFDDDTCTKLCDIAMDGDRAIAKEMGLNLDITGTLANGDEACKLYFHK